MSAPGGSFSWAQEVGSWHCEQRWCWSCLWHRHLLMVQTITVLFFGGGTGALSLHRTPKSSTLCKGVALAASSVGAEIRGSRAIHMQLSPRIARGSFYSSETSRAPRIAFRISQHIPVLGAGRDNLSYHIPLRGQEMGLQLPGAVDEREFFCPGWFCPRAPPPSRTARRWEGAQVPRWEEMGRKRPHVGHPCL